jgi:hypothetical protein
MIKNLLFISLLCLATTRVFGQSLYYVNDASTTGDVFTDIAGNDGSGDGTAATPYATVQNVFDSHTLVSGDS